MMFVLAGINELYAAGGPRTATLDGLKKQAWGVLDGLRAGAGRWSPSC